jgi:hypothetical protein
LYLAGRRCQGGPEFLHLFAGLLLLHDFHHVSSGDESSCDSRSGFPRMWWLLVNLLYLLRDFRQGLSPHAAPWSDRRAECHHRRRCLGTGHLLYAGGRTMHFASSEGRASSTMGLTGSSDALATYAGCSPPTPSALMLVAGGTSS